MKLLYLFKLNLETGTIVKYEVDYRYLATSRGNCIVIERTYKNMKNKALSEHVHFDESEVGTVRAMGISLFSFDPDMEKAKDKFIEHWSFRLNKARKDLNNAQARTSKADAILNKLCA